VLLAIEHDASSNAALQATWQLSDQAFPSALRKIGWAGRRDGVGSEAMFELLVRLHALRSDGRTIDIVAFNGFRDEEQRRKFANLPAQGPREAAQADNIRRAAENRAYDHVLVLVGELHARKIPVEEGPVSFKPMAMQLGASADVTSLEMKVSGGSMWNCLVRPRIKLEPGKPIPAGALDCGNHEIRFTGGEFGATPFIRLRPPSRETPRIKFDGFYWLGRVSGSPPVVWP
jgi:hypothetical protein